jgi:hypothetical protein
MKKWFVRAGLLALGIVGLACAKADALPEGFQGKYKVSRFVLGNVTLVVEGKSLSVPDCKVNCGEEKQTFKTLLREGGIGGKIYKFTTEFCEGKIEQENDGKLSISASPVASSTIKDEGRRNMTCSQISGNHLAKL